jgi:phosphatidyl-myo-inositol dimannoside synthase
MRILALVTDAFGSHGGIGKFNRDLLSALCAHPGVEEVVALPRLMSEAPGALPAKLTHLTSGLGGKLHYIVAVLKSALRAPRYDLVICGHINLLPVGFLARQLIPKSEIRNPKSEIAPPHFALRASPLALRLCPVLLVTHGIDAWQPTRSRLANYLARKVSAFISVSEFTRQRFLEWAKLDAPRGFILPNSIDLARFCPGPKNPQLLARYGLRDRPVLLTVARLSAQERYKGVDEVLEVLPGLMPEVPGLSYLIVGDGDDRERLMGKAASLGLSVSAPDSALRAPHSALRTPPSTHRPSPAALRPLTSVSSPQPSPQVIFAGHVPEEEKVDHYRLADAFVMPGWGEGFGIVYLEAMACGVPVVASKADASREVVRNGELGFVVNPKNPAEIKAAILQAVACGPKLESRAALEHFSRERFEQRVHCILDDLFPRRKDAGSLQPVEALPAGL